MQRVGQVDVWMYAMMCCQFQSAYLVIYFYFLFYLNRLLVENVKGNFTFFPGKGLKK